MKCTNKKIRPLFLIILLIFIDQASKYIVRFRQPAEGGFYICNTGVTFGIHLPFWLVLTIGFAFIFFVGFLIFPPQADQPLAGNELLNYKFKNFNFISNFIRRGGSNYFPLILILSGAVSNIIDRLYFGCVVDFIDLKIWPIFNLADIFITTGAIMILYRLFSAKG